jgi:hypothetical protein
VRDVDELKTMLRDKADEMRADTEMPGVLLKRSRRRRVLNLSVAFAIVGAVGFGSFAGLNLALDKTARPPALTPAAPDSDGTSGLVAAEYTLTIGEQATTTEVAALLVGKADWRMRPENLGLHIALDIAGDRPLTTRIICSEKFALEATELKEKVFPEAEIELKEPAGPHDIQVLLGTTFDEAHSHEVSSVGFVHEFMRHRYLGHGAEDFLSPEARRQFDARENSLSLYGYTTDPGPFRPSIAYMISAMSLKGTGVEIEVAIDNAKDQQETIVESFMVEPSESESGGSNIWIASALRETV